MESISYPLIPATTTYPRRLPRLKLLATFHGLPCTVKASSNVARAGLRNLALTALFHSSSSARMLQLMRSWKGFENEKGVYDHVLRYLPRDTTIFEAMQPGDEYPAANKVANALFEKEARRKRIKRDSKEWKKLHRAMVPPYDPSKFPNRWWKLRANGPSRTLMAHIGKDTYSHIHYDSAQARVITVREAARLQSFPDGFRFAGTMNPAFRQIGNAVPPAYGARHRRRNA